MNPLQRAFDFFRETPSRGLPPGAVEMDGQFVPILFQKNPLARRYRLYVDREGRPHVTIPRRGTLREAHQFAEKHQTWLESQLRRISERLRQKRYWPAGTEIFFRGDRVAVGVEPNEDFSRVWIGAELAGLIPRFIGPNENLQPLVEKFLRQLAVRELPGRTLELATRHGCTVKRVTIRSQRSRWGSCSARATVSLNWRLVQVPPAVCAYVVIHELMHLREMNHSRRFWKLVAEACPGFESHEQWLREHERLIL